MPTEKPTLTLYFDGSCALCRAEIGHYRRQEGAENLCFADVSSAEVAPGPDLDRQQAMARFHVRDAAGNLVSGAAAFAMVWETLPRWRWAAKLARLPGVMGFLELGYRLFLPVRPLLSKAFGRLGAKRGAGP